MTAGCEAGQEAVKKAAFDLGRHYRLGHQPTECLWQGFSQAAIHKSRVECEIVVYCNGKYLNKKAISTYAPLLRRVVLFTS
jgi:hypothetical protein